MCDLLFKEKVEALSIIIEFVGLSQFIIHNNIQTKLTANETVEHFLRAESCQICSHHCCKYHFKYLKVLNQKKHEKSIRESISGNRRILSKQDFRKEIRKKNPNYYIFPTEE